MASSTNSLVLHGTIQYPPNAVQLHHECVVMVFARVGVDGHVSESRLDKTSGFLGIDQAAFSSVSAWLFEPASR
jgi:periplasmic protein TonB